MKSTDRNTPRIKTKEPVHIRRNVDAFEDPCKIDEHLPDYSVCRECGGTYVSGRWHSPNHLTRKPKSSSAEQSLTTCPTCRKLRGHVPGGVIRLTGEFVLTHREEILNLIRNQTRKGDAANSAGRVMTMEAQPDGMELTTTNEKLAQRIGRALYKAYSGEVEYKWSPDDGLARVNWHRETQKGGHDK